MLVSSVETAPLASIALHERLAVFNRRRLQPGLPHGHWQTDLTDELALRAEEYRFLEEMRSEVIDEAAQAPTDPDRFIAWFDGLRRTGPGQGDPLFRWLAEDASFAEMRWFIAQEVAGEAGFDDLVALAQIKMPPRAKIEMARNYWDEMGRGQLAGMHGHLLDRVAMAMQIVPGVIPAIPDAITLSNLMMGLACNPSLAYHAIGALGVIELTAPDRVSLVAAGLARLGLSREQRRYYDLHATLDPLHSQAWNREVLRPMIADAPPIATAIAQGALMRLHAGRRCFVSYRRSLGI